MDGQATCRGVWAMEDYKKAFTLVVQRTRKGGQQCLDLGEDTTDDETTMTDGRYIYRALATKVVCHARRVSLKFRPDQARLVKTLLAALAPPRPPPLPGVA